MELFAKKVNGFELWVLGASTISRLFLEFSVKPVFRDSSGKFSYLWCSDFWKIHLRLKKLTRLFYLYPKTEYLPRFSLSPTKRKKITHSLQVALFRKSVSPSRRLSDLRSETKGSRFESGC